MGDMFRSEKMSLCQMFIQPEAAYRSVSELGEAGCVQFRDLNTEVNSFQRKFVSEVRRCEELERKIRYIELEIKKDCLVIPDNVFDNIPRAPNPREIISLEADLEKIENEILELSQNDVNLKSNFLELTELRIVLENTQIFFEEQEVIDMESKERQTERGRLGFIAGVVSRERVFAFERMLWRISRGNIYLKKNDLDAPLKDPKTGSPMYKTVFVVFYQGDQLQSRVKKVCTGFHAALYPCPSTHFEREEMVGGVRTRIEDLKMVISQTEEHRNRVLTTVAKNLMAWTIMVKKMKAIYHTLNYFNIDVTEKCMIGEGWVPTRDLPLVQQALLDGSAAVGSSVPSFVNVIDTNQEPPTYNRTNKFTRGFQNLIDAYGMADYREVNPALYTCITFPFLFGVMFGDLGHGFILFLFGAYMVLFEKKLGRRRGGEIWNIFFTGRYIIMLMGLFACYTGFTYNDVFSKSLNVFGSTWRIRYNTSTVLTNPSLQLNPTYSNEAVYPIGMDPIWQLADNKIIFFNTYKMKLSIIFGVLHMSFGVCLSVVNYVYFKRYASIFLEFIPQIVFLLLLFGYLCFMMFFKWVRYSAQSIHQADTPGCAPSVLIMFINMMLFKKSKPLKGCDEYFFSFQPTLETIFVLVALVCIPWMLLGKPLYIKFTRKEIQQEKRISAASFNNESVVDNGNVVSKAGGCTQIGNGGQGREGGGSSHEEDEPMSEIYIHQAIHTIEYVLSTISHTASYLRLWALSLAHAQLSEVLWTMVMTMGLHMKGFAGSIGVYFIFGAWTLGTIAIMIMMEGLSAFLHTLRLHWVEFMSKFYHGAGYAFRPFSFKIILAEEDED